MCVPPVSNPFCPQVQLVQEVSGHEGPVWAAAFSADARLLATGGRDGAVAVWAVYFGAGLAAAEQGPPLPSAAAAVQGRCARRGEDG